MQVHSCHSRAVESHNLHGGRQRRAGTVSRSTKGCRRARCAVVVHASMEEEAHRNTVKNLTRLFYGPTANAPTTASQPGNSSSSSSSIQQRRSRVLTGSQIPSLPLWRVEWSVLPGMQEILHVIAPHYVHLFEKVFSQPRPWVFGHLYLPGGSKSLGARSHALASGSKAPLVGVLMQVTRAVRLRDGKFLLLATALARFKVSSCIRELPYSEADVELLEDCEHLETLSSTATAAVLQAAPADTSVPGLMSASTAAAREAAAALHWSWLRGYELQVAAGQEWPGPGPREGENDMETYHMVQELAAQGVADVLPLPDGVVIGRCNLEQVAQDAAAAMQEALQEAAVRFTSSSSSSSSGGGSSSSGGSSASGQTDPSSRPGSQEQVDAGGSQQGDNLEDAGSNNTSSSDSSSSSGSSSSSSSSSGQDSLLSSTEGDPVIASLNTVAERGVALQGPEAEALTATISCSTTEEVLMLEAAVWQQLDILAALSTRVKGRRHSLPFGLLQLRPPRPQLSVAAATLLANQAAATQATDQADAAAGASQQPSRSSSSSESSSALPEFIQPGRGQPLAADVAPNAVDAGSSSSPADPPDTPHSSSSERADSGDRGTSSSGSTSSSLSSRSRADPAAQYLSASKYAFAASEGMDVHADPLWPSLRRAAKLSWAAALVTGEFDLDKGPATSDLRQALLETPSIASRLRYVLAVLQKHAKVLAALAAVKDVQE